MRRLSLHFGFVLLAFVIADTALGHGPGAGGSTGWNWELWLLVSLSLAVVTYLLGMRRMGREQRHRLLDRFRFAAFAGGIATLIIALISPLDALADHLFSAHMTQHLLLLLVAPPLLVASRPVITWLWAFNLRQRRAIGHVWMRGGLHGIVRPLMLPLPVWLLLTFVLWFWHLPAPYVWALNSEAVHVLEHLSFLIVSLAFWNIVIQPYGRRALDYGASLLYVASIGFQNGLLGAVLTFAAQPLYPLDTAPFGLARLEDQQLAGVIMWVPASAVHLWTLGALFMAWLGEAGRRADSLRMGFSTSVTRCALIAPLLAMLLASCAEETSAPVWRVLGGDPQRAPRLIREYGCDACHTIPGIAGANGNIGPPLTGMGERVYVAGMLRNTPDNLIHWIRYPQRVVPGNAMLNLGVTEKDARDIAAYLYTLR